MGKDINDWKEKLLNSQNVSANAQVSGSSVKQDKQ